MKIMPPFDFDRLFVSLKQGDVEAKNYFFQVLRDRIAQVAKYYVTGNEVEDLVQETMKTFSEKLDGLTRPEVVLPFCIRILKNKIGNYFQKKQSLKNVPLDDVELYDYNTPAATVESEEALEKIRAAIAEVAGRSEEFAKLSALLRAGWSMGEIIKAFGDENKEVLYSRIYRFRTRLKEVLRKNYGIDI